VCNIASKKFQASLIKDFIEMVAICEIKEHKEEKEDRNEV